MITTPLNMQYTRQQLIDALANEWALLCSEDPEDDDMSDDDYRSHLATLSFDQLIVETDIDSDGYTLDEYMSNHS